MKLKEHKSLLHMELTKKKVKREEVMHFSRQLGAFVRAGVPIVDAVNVIAQEASNERFKSVLVEVADALRGGETFTDAMAAHADVFPRYYIDILRSAELTGSLDTVLDQLAGYIERDLEARRSITSALIYPAIVMAMALVTVAVLTGFVLPRFKEFFESFDAKLPLPDAHHDRPRRASSGTSGGPSCSSSSPPWPGHSASCAPRAASRSATSAPAEGARSSAGSCASPSSSASAGSSPPW